MPGGGHNTKMRVLITGATGFIGSHLCRALVEAGHTIRALIRPTSSLALIDGLEVDLAVGDLMDPDSLYTAMRGVDVVMHCGAEVGGWVDRKSMVASHIVGTEHILQTAMHANVDRLLHTSSVAALGVPELTPAGHEPVLLDELHTWNYDPDDWPYGYAKHCAEQRVLEAVDSGLDAMILNPTAVIGPGDKNLVASAIVYHMGRGRRPPIPPGGINVIHVADVVAGYLAAMEHGRRGERYILGGQNLPFDVFLQAIARVVQVSPLRLRPPLWIFNRLAGIIDSLGPVLKLPVRGHILRMVGRHFYYDMSKAGRELGFYATKTYQDAIQSAHDWYRTHLDPISA